MDPQRFMVWDRIEEGYAAYLSEEIRRRRSLIFVASSGGRIVGYTYGRIEPRDWNALREGCGAIQDVYVDGRHRRKGIAAALLRQLIQSLAELGAPRVYLMTAARNTSAHRLFEKLGFRSTMLEMTIECNENSAHGTAKTARME
jgi:ribosomal protein S18 acetylase RimI-like enzyme